MLSNRVKVAYFSSQCHILLFLEIAVKMRIIKVGHTYAYYGEEKTYDLYH